MRGRRQALQASMSSLVRIDLTQWPSPQPDQTAIRPFDGTRPGQAVLRETGTRMSISKAKAAHASTGNDPRTLVWARAGVDYVHVAA